MKTLMRTKEKLSKDENGVSIDRTFCRSMIESLLYLITSRLTFFLVLEYVQGIKQILRNQTLLQLRKLSSM